LGEIPSWLDPASPILTGQIAVSPRSTPNFSATIRALADEAAAAMGVPPTVKDPTDGQALAWLRENRNVILAAGAIGAAVLFLGGRRR
jgi:hypothetical protein